MPNKLLLTLLTALPLLASGCADHAGSVTVAGGPSAPINDPDPIVMPAPGQNTGSGGNSGGAPVVNQPAPPSGGPTGGSTNQPPPSGGGGGGGGSGSNTPTPPGGNGNPQPGSNPVPEPGTLLLFGSGIAGLAGASIRRRRRRKS